MRSYEFVADRLIVESLLLEQNYEEIFRIVKSKDLETKKIIWTLYHGVDDPHGEMFDNKRAAKQAQSRLINSAKKAAAQAARAATESALQRFINWPLKIFGRVAKWLTFRALVTVVAVGEEGLQLNNAIQKYENWIKSTEVCSNKSLKYDITLIDRERAQKHATEISNEITDGIWTVLLLASVGTAAMLTALKLLKFIPGPQQLVTLGAWIGAGGILWALERFLENDKTFPAIRNFIHRRFTGPYLLDKKYIERVCQDKVFDPANIIDTIPGINLNEGQDFNFEFDNDPEALQIAQEVGLIDIWNEVLQDPKMQEYIKEAERKKANNEIIP